MRNTLIKSVSLFLIVFAFGLKISAQKENVNNQQKILEIMQTLTAEDLYAYVDTLSSDQFEGRLTGHIGYDKSADWVIKKFKEWNIKPLGVESNYLQKFPHPYTDIFKPCQLQMIDKNNVLIKDYEYIEEFIPGSTSGNGEVKAEVVYVGFGISAPELAYDDYAGVDVKGKIVLIDREVPVKTENEEFLKWRPYSFHQYKALNAFKHGAVGMLYNYHIANPNNEYIQDFLISQVGDTVVSDLFAGTGFNYDEVMDEIKLSLKPKSFNTSKRFLIKSTTFHHPEGVGSNVIGFIEGSDSELKNEYIIIGGHLDFLGKCYEIMPGANDNASAVSVTLAIAKALAQNEIKLKRSVVFLMFGAEEAGIRGAQFFLKNLPVPLEKIVALLNMDGVGIGDKISVGFSENYPSLYSYIETSNSKYVNAQLEGGYWKNISRPRQDAVFFDWYGIPTLSFAAFGDLQQNKDSKYHTPYDNIKYITPEIMESLSKILFLSIVEMANDNKMDIKRGELKPEFINGYDFNSIITKNN